MLHDKSPGWSPVQAPFVPESQRWAARCGFIVYFQMFYHSSFSVLHFLLQSERWLCDFQSGILVSFEHVHMHT